VFTVSLNGNGSPYAMSCLSVTLVCCGQTVGRIKMILSTEVDLGPVHIVLDGDPAPPRKGELRLCDLLQLLLAYDTQRFRKVAGYCAPFRGGAGSYLTQSLLG